jgi:hypothetical protein
LTDAEAVLTGHVGYVNANGVLCGAEAPLDTSFREFRGKYVPLGDGFVYADNASRGVYFDAQDGTGRQIVYRITDLWEKGEGRYFASSFSELVPAGERAYFNTKSGVMAIDKSLVVISVCELDCVLWGLRTASAGLVGLLDREGSVTLDIAPERIPDIDGDGCVTVLDMALLDRYIALFKVDIDKYNADGNGDYKIDSEDAAALESTLLSISLD